jgi:HD-like signal output (HDOD) protein
MSQWNLPENYCLVARDHHLAEFDGNNFLLVLVRLANQVCNKMGIGLIEDPSIVLLETPEAAQLQLSEIDLARLEVRLEDSQLPQVLYFKCQFPGAKVPFNILFD